MSRQDQSYFHSRPRECHHCSPTHNTFFTQANQKHMLTHISCTAIRCELQDILARDAIELKRRNKLAHCFSLFPVVYFFTHAVDTLYINRAASISLSSHGEQRNDLLVLLVQIHLGSQLLKYLGDHAKLSHNNSTFS